ncbi:energy transducer TonB [Mucilaginibacter angelicae]|uniref:Energy transducer TonB n=1 Tax=Mucilaginibacter angelicae TaxID=869718 RepID=A0ABV6L844_9SPHI
MNLKLIHRHIFLIVCLLTFNNCFAQSKKYACSGRQDSLLHKFVYTEVDKMPEPVGGVKALSAVLSKNFKYPPGDAEYFGKVIVAFVIDPDGNIEGARIINDPSGERRLFGSQLIRIINMLKWKPGECNGKAVPVLYMLPLRVDFSE